MLRSLLLGLILILVSTFSYAEEIVEHNNNATKLTLPNCNDSKLHQLLQRKISEYYNTHLAVSQLEQRTQKLISRHMNYFEAIDTATFSPKDNIFVANKLMGVKINNGLEDNEIRICRTRITGNLPDVYLLIYPYNYSYMVDIINFAGVSSSRDFFIIYN